MAKTTNTIPSSTGMLRMRRLMMNCVMDPDASDMGQGRRPKATPLPMPTRSTRASAD